jgi:mono/diheme cytochrome c family protein
MTRPLRLRFLSPRLRRLAAATVLLVTVPACQSDDGGGTAAASGQEAFETYCISCHGAQARGTDQGPPLVDVIYEPSHHPDEAFRNAARQGVAPHHWDFGPMPPVPGISDAEIDAVIAYVRALQREAGID